MAANHCMAALLNKAWRLLLLGCDFWAPTEPSATHKMNYYVPNFGVDSEIADAQKNMADMESKFPLKDAAV